MNLLIDLIYILFSLLFVLLTILDHVHGMDKCVDATRTPDIHNIRLLIPLMLALYSSPAFRFLSTHYCASKSWVLLTFFCCVVCTQSFSMSVDLWRLALSFVQHSFLPMKFYHVLCMLSLPQIPSPVKP